MRYSAQSIPKNVFDGIYSTTQAFSLSLYDVYKTLTQMCLSFRWVQAFAFPIVCDSAEKLRFLWISTLHFILLFFYNDDQFFEQWIYYFDNVYFKLQVFDNALLLAVLSNFAKLSFRLSYVHFVKNVLQLTLRNNCKLVVDFTKNVTLHFEVAIGWRCAF